MYGILRGYPHSHFYRTYRTLPYTVPPQRKALALSRAVGNIANVVFPQQCILPRVQRPHDPVGREAPAAVHLGKTLRVFTSDRKENISSGIYEAGTHNVIPVKNCLIENETAQAIIATVTDLIKSFRLTVYDEDRKTGLLRHILVRTAHVTGQVMVTLVLSSTMFPSKNNFIKALREAHPEITTIVMNINNRRTSMVLGDREDVIFGRGYIEDELCGCRFCISSKSFYQVNSAQTEILYNKAMEFANLKDGDTVIDAYCGIGTIGITAAMQANPNYGPLSDSPLRGAASFTDPLVANGFDEVTYIGAFADENDGWMSGWTEFDPQNKAY